jgi:hypothetical protein
LFDQGFIDGAQRRHPGAGAKLMQPPDIGGALPMIQQRKTSPRTLFGRRRITALKLCARVSNASK